MWKEEHWTRGIIIYTGWASVKFLFKMLRLHQRKYTSCIFKISQIINWLVYLVTETKKVALLLMKLIAICRWGRKPSLQTCSTDEGNKWLPKYWYLVLARLININSGKKRQVLIILNGTRWQTSSWCYAFFQLSENSLFWILENV